MASLPHFHCMAQLDKAVLDGLSAVRAAHQASTEPTQLSLQVRVPNGPVVVLATVSVQPPPAKKQRRTVEGEVLGGYHGHALFKRKETGAVTRIKELLESDDRFLQVALATHGTSKKGTVITNKTYLAESLVDKAWASLCDEDKQPWKMAAQRAKRHLDAVDWTTLRGALDTCPGFDRFVSGLRNGKASVCDKFIDGDL